MYFSNINKVMICTVLTFFINPIIIKPILNYEHDQYKIDLLDLLN